MRFLILTQKVDKDDAILGFFHEWIREFSKNVESVIVICLWKGGVDLPENVKVLSLGKENNTSKLNQILSFYKYIWQERKNYDSVFVHMNQIYVILGGFIWKMWHKKIALWYVHRQNSFSLWLATKFVDNIFTSSPESFTVVSDKVSYVGHGVDSSRFSGNVFNRDNSKTKIVHVGRISEIKDLETLILAGEILNKKISNLSIELYGAPSNDADKTYVEELKKLIKEKNLENLVLFKGPVSNAEISGVYAVANLSVNMSPKGGWDKVVIESIMAQCPVFASNLALKPVFGEYSDKFLFEYKNPLDLANKVEAFLATPDKETVIKSLHDHVVAEYDFKNLIRKITVKLND
ncbi:MAG: glycosyltransferase [Minisyncoccota bacterium]